MNPSNLCAPAPARSSAPARARAPAAAVVAMPVALVMLLVLALGGCAAPLGSDPASGQSAAAATTSATGMGAATGAELAECASLATGFRFTNTTLTAAAVVAAGTVSHAGQPVPEHCRITGRMNPRTSPVDGQAYAIGFEMRLPKSWSGRYLYQGNGGTDGVVAPALGGLALGGGGMLRNALQMGFAIISSDAGHSAAQNPLFGLDPQARLDYGYQAVGTLTPMAKALIKAAYGKAPDRSYIGGTSNGGRHAMVAASRYADQYDGIFASAPGLNLPLASVANMWSVQQFDKVATTKVLNGQPDYESALPVNERRVLAQAILARCDALDGLADGMVNDVEACRTAFNLERDVPTCSGARDGSCLSSLQKSVLAAVFAGARNKAGTALYSGFPFDPGIVQAGWADWRLRASLGKTRNPVSVGFIFMAPPASTAILADTAAFALSFDVETQRPRIFATSGPYTEAAMSFMTPPNPTQFTQLRQRGGKMIVVHGEADGIFSSDDTAAWYRALDVNHRGTADQFVRYFRVPGMGHSRGGPATDQFDALSALVDWVERGIAPTHLVAQARGAGHVGGVNADVPADWAPARSRPLCPYPRVARYKGGDREAAASFACER